MKESLRAATVYAKRALEVFHNGAKYMDVTSSVCPERVLLQSPESTSQNLRALSADPVRSSRPSLSQLICLRMFHWPVT